MKNIFLLASLLLIHGCANSNQTGPCADGIDNDGDGWIDGNDPGCEFNNGQAEAPNPDLPQCSDGRDNDGDGDVDFPADRSCSGPNDPDEFGNDLPACDDGKDNDGDGLFDYPNDPGCALPEEGSEGDDCPGGPLCPSCSNGIDDDGDGNTDYPADPGCQTAGDRTEKSAVANECGAQIELGAIPYDNGEVFGAALTKKPSELEGSCGGRGHETAFKMNVPVRSVIVLSTDHEETDLDTIVYARSVCDDAATELECNDDTSGRQSRIEATVNPGTYYVVVDAVDSNTSGQFRLTSKAYTPVGDPCDPTNAQCLPGYVCRKLTDAAATETCELPECEDGLDNDGDGKIDFPLEPGCDAPNDNSESDECPSGPTCPQCSNGADDDANGFTDYPNDVSCDYAADPLEIPCAIESDPVIFQGVPSLTDRTTSATEDFDPGCGFSNGAPDVVHAFVVPGELKTLQVDTIGSTFDTILTIRQTSCGAPELACDDDGGPGFQVSQINLTDVAAGAYAVVVDGYSNNSGIYTLNIRGEIKSGETCNPTTEASGMFPCETGYSCQSGTCQVAVCNDGVDNDGDGLTDFPFDPGCDTLSDNDETDDCPTGPNCPACSNNTDDDGDNLTDWGQDIGCIAASDNDETDECIAGVPFTMLTNAGLSGTTPLSSAGSNFTPSCHSSTSATEDVYAYAVTEDFVSLTFTTEGSAGDTVTSVRYQDCGRSSAELVCEQTQNGGEAATLSNPAVGTYFIFVDGDWVSNINYDLNVRGTLPQGATCNPTDTQFTCHNGLACESNVCVPSDCNDGLDNDGDGKTDYPDDPGCLDIDDNDENDDCPTGPNCPACGNGQDDDGDMVIDFAGGDPGCDAASDSSEIDNCIPGVEVKFLPDSGVTGTTPPSGNANFSPSCHSSTTSTEDVYVYPVSTNYTEITFSTIGSPEDTVLYVRLDMCDDANAEIDCNQVQNGGEAITIPNPAAGDYFVFVDGDFQSEVDYVLNVSAKLPMGATCSPSNTQFTCGDGLTCESNICTATDCNDGVDNDGDGNIDFPNEPGCISIDDNDETDACPSGAGCPECSNGVDDDGDNLVDFGNDPGCEFAADNVEIDDCIPGVPVQELPLAGASGTTPASSAGSNFSSSCNSSTSSTEDVYGFKLDRPLTSFTIHTGAPNGGDTVTYVRFDVCNDTNSEVACLNTQNGGESVVVNAPPQGNYFIFVDGDFQSEIDYTLGITGTIPSGETCDATDPQFICETGTSCTGGVCTGTACNDGLDNDGDGKTDFPDDPGCYSVEDTDETDGCPSGTDCPQCSNTTDDDADGAIDFPLDPGCFLPSDLSEVTCPDTEPVTDLRASVNNTTTTGATDDSTPTCASSSAPDIVFSLVSPGAIQSLVATTDGSSYDTVLYVKGTSCSSAELDCDDDGGEGTRSKVELTNQPAGEYFFFVDGFSSNSGDVIFTVEGTLVSGASCNPFQNYLTCPQGETCTSGATGHTCQ